MLGPAPAAILSALLANYWLTPTGIALGLVIRTAHFTPPRNAADLALPLSDNLTPARSAFPALPAAAYPGARLILATTPGGVMARHPGATLIFPNAVPAALADVALELPPSDRRAFADTIAALLASPPPLGLRKAEWGDGGETAWRTLPGATSPNAARLATIIAAARDWRDPRLSAHDVVLGARIAEVYGVI